MKAKDNKNTQTVEDQQPEFIEKVLTINRVSKVVKGGKRMSFSALVVVGDGQGSVGYALGKANEVSEAIKKGLAEAKINMVQIPMRGHTIPHEMVGIFGAAKIILKPAAPGTGVIAGAAARAVFEAAGVQDILTKSLKTNNPLNVIKATMAGLDEIKRIVAASEDRKKYSRN